MHTSVSLSLHTVIVQEVPPRVIAVLDAAASEESDRRLRGGGNGGGDQHRRRRRRLINSPFAHVPLSLSLPGIFMWY